MSFCHKRRREQQVLADELGLSLAQVKARVNNLHENNPMLGHRGCRLGNTYPEITEMQTRAILGAAIELQREGIKVLPEIMVPQVLSRSRSYSVRPSIALPRSYLLRRVLSAEYKVGTMIEILALTLIADKIAEHAEFFSFGTNDLTQMTFGYSRDDINSFLPDYLGRRYSLWIHSKCWIRRVSDSW